LLGTNYWNCHPSPSSTKSIGVLVPPGHYFIFLVLNATLLIWLTCAKTISTGASDSGLDSHLGVGVFLGSHRRGPKSAGAVLSLIEASNIPCQPFAKGVNRARQHPRPPSDLVRTRRFPRVLGFSHTYSVFTARSSCHFSLLPARTRRRL
jgi:hypothetical protein